MHLEGGTTSMWIRPCAMMWWYPRRKFESRIKSKEPQGHMFPPALLKVIAADLLEWSEPVDVLANAEPSYREGERRSIGVARLS
ncbi:hypothetical protein KIN20_028127 [Parelaphostrongylus tenuis]|uniref:Uncharacterized protein n=1 Tax=Parelaphostrongylus tenuis TaxID=148309 RepID=A0AAD5R0A2_PARTN|nr:hypothetical protein KIN20_028127 [Parelaphostrongylus tenuis]